MFFAWFAGRCVVRCGIDLDASVLESGHSAFKIVGLQAEMEAVEWRISTARELEHGIAKAQISDIEPLWCPVLEIFFKTEIRLVKSY